MAIYIKSKSGDYYKVGKGGTRTKVKKPVIISRVKNGKKEQLAPEPNNKTSSSTGKANQTAELKAPSINKESEVLQPKITPVEQKQVSQQVIKQVYFPDRPRFQETPEIKKDINVSVGFGLSPVTLEKERLTTYEKLTRNYNKFFQKLEVDEAKRAAKQQVQQPGNQFAGVSLATVGVFGAKFVGGVAEFGAGVFKDFSAVDYKTGKLRIPLTDTAKAIINPVETTSGIINQVVKDPARGLGQVAGMVALGKAGGKIAKGQPLYEVSKATGNIRILETPKGSQILVESVTKEYKGSKTPKPKAFYAEVEGTILKTGNQAGIINKVKQTLKIDPLKNKINVIKTRSTWAAIQESFNAASKKSLDAINRIEKTTSKVGEYTRTKIQEAKLYVSDNPQVSLTPEGINIFADVTKPRSGRIVEGFDVFEQKVKGYERTLTKKIKEIEIKVPGLDNTLSYKSGSIIKRPTSPKSPPQVKGQGGINQAVVADLTAKGELLVFNIKKIPKPIVSVLKKPISVTSQTIKAAVEGSVLKNKDSSDSQTLIKKSPVLEKPAKAEGDTRVKVKEKSLFDSGRVVAPPVYDYPELKPKVESIIRVEGDTKPRDKKIDAIKPKINSDTSRTFPPINIVEPVEIQQSKPSQIIDVTNTTQQSRRMVYPVIRTTPQETIRRNIFTPRNVFNNEVKKQYGYKVQVRRRGKFHALPGIFSKADALSLGAYNVKKTAAATFKVNPVRQSINKSFGQRIGLAGFYRKGDLFIQKRSQRIGSLGEKQEITFKGIYTLKRKKGKKNIFGV